MLYFREDILNHVICIVWNSWGKIFNIFELSKTVLNNETSLRDKCRIQMFSGPLFLAFGLSTEWYGVSLRIQSEYGKIWSRKTPNMNTCYIVFFYESQSILPYELRVIILGNKKVLANISKLSEKAAYSQFFFP